MNIEKTGQVICARRKELGLTQKQLAEMLSVTDRAVSRWERGVGFPDVSMLEPLADALGLSLVELMRGERLPPEGQPSQETEREVRSTVREVLGHFQRCLKRARWQLTVLAVLLFAAAGVFTYLWFQPEHHMVGSETTVSAAEALTYFPDCLITREEFALAAELLADEDVKEQFYGSESGEPYPVQELDADRFIKPGVLQVEGRDPDEVSITVRPSCIEVWYHIVLEEREGYDSSGESVTYPVHRQDRSLQITGDGRILKMSNDAYPFSLGPALRYSVLNWDNEEFTLLTERRDLFYPFHRE